MSAELVWETPPRMNHREWIDNLLATKNRPGEWARVWVFDTEHEASNARGYAGRPRFKETHRAGRYEFAVRKIAGCGFGLWARYVGEA